MAASSGSFTSLLYSDHYSFPDAGGSRGLADRIAERTGSGVPKLKSIPPPSLPICPPVSPSSFFAIPPGLSPAELLDSPVLLSSSKILPSPTTGTFPAQAFNWKNNTNNGQHQGIKKEERNFSDFSFQPQTRPQSSSSTAVFQSQPTSVPTGQESWNSAVESEFLSMQCFSPEISTIQTNDQSNGEFHSDYNQSSKTLSEKKGPDDGYKWRKYGQKKLKGSENPRSYYKCTYPNCLMRKKLERSLEGQITEIVYKGNHNHHKPPSTRRSSSADTAAAAVSSQAIQDGYSFKKEIQQQSYLFQGNGQMDSAVTHENSSISMGDDDFDQSSQKSKSGIDQYDEDEPDAKRWRGGCESEGVSAPGSRTVKPRVVVQTTSEIDVLDDGYRWTKYGQKVVRGNPNPRSYYKCTHPSCPVRKLVERAPQDSRAVITTYEGKHNHDVPAPLRRAGGSRSLYRPSPYIANGDAPMATRPSAQAPSTLEMLQGPESFVFSGFGHSLSSCMNNSQYADCLFQSQGRTSRRPVP